MSPSNYIAVTFYAEERLRRRMFKPLMNVHGYLRRRQALASSVIAIYPRSD